jgi:hypothetical protein
MLHAYRKRASRVPGLDRVSKALGLDDDDGSVRGTGDTGNGVGSDGARK